MEVLELRSAIFVTRIHVSKFQLKWAINIFPIHNTSIPLAMFRIMKLSRYVIVYDDDNYVTFHKLNVRIKIKK